MFDAVLGFDAIIQMSAHGGEGERVTTKEDLAGNHECLACSSGRIAAERGVQS